MKFMGIIVLALAFVLVSGDDRGHEHERYENGKLKEEQQRKKEESKVTRAKSDRELSAEPVVGEFNVTAKDGQLCIRMDAGIRLDVTYETRNGTKRTTSIVSDHDTSVDRFRSLCRNGSSDPYETLGLDLGKQRKLNFEFSREHNVTGDKNGAKWQLYRIKFELPFDPVDFPDATEGFGHFENSDPLKQIGSSRGRSYGCSKLDAITVDKEFKVTLINLRVQAFMSTEDFGQADWCAQEQTSDLVPIIIGAALAALVIIVLIAYLVGRARARTTNYDNI